MTLRVVLKQDVDLRSCCRYGSRGRRRKDKLALEKLQARAASAAPAGGTPGSSPAPPSPQAQQPGVKLPSTAGAFLSIIAQHVSWQAPQAQDAC